MSLPLVYKGFSTIELLNLWDKIGEGSAHGTDKNLVFIMHSFLKEFKISPISWPINEDHDKLRERANRLIAELRANSQNI